MRSLTMPHRILIAGVALVAALWAAPARAQLSADVAVSIDTLSSIPVTGVEPNADQISWGQTKVYEITLTNAGPNHAEGVALTDFTAPAELELKSIAGCVPTGTVSAANPLGLPCSVLGTNGIGQLIDGESEEIDVTVKLPLPDPTDPADPLSGLAKVCPVGDELADTTATISSSSDTWTDPDTSNNTSTFVNTLGAWADLQITMTAPSNASVGDTIDVGVHLVNTGPCTAVAVEAVDYGADAWTSFTLNFLGQDDAAGSSGPCNAAAADGMGCVMGDMAAAATEDYTMHFQVLTLPDTLTQSGDPVTTQVWSGGRPYYGTSGHNKHLRTWDPNDVNNKGRTNTIVQHTAKSCSTGGMGDALSLLALALPFALRRRRRA
ncbi:MAG TPA: hypothetical protein VMU15_16410 [Anaeromyxobacter sp.]|nr:hypothetical protein [Anaeromyxobacter sp.]